MIDTRKVTKQILKTYGIFAKKSFGQNFLVDDSILGSIANLAETDMQDLIIEIGPGLGNLTYYLKEKSYLLLFEIDTRMINILNDRFVDKRHIEIVNKDILKVNIDEEISRIENTRNKKFKSVKVVANLPYYITSPILFKLLEDSSRIDEIIVMVQNEVADRIAAVPSEKDYGILTVMMDFYSDSKKEIIVPASSFIPEPNVTSAVVRIVKKEKYPNVNRTIFNELVHKAFANRRKKMINSLMMNNFMNLDKEKIKDIFASCKLDENTRAEELTTDKYAEITNFIEANYM